MGTVTSSAWGRDTSLTPTSKDETRPDSFQVKSRSHDLSLDPGPPRLFFRSTSLSSSSCPFRSSSPAGKQEVGLASDLDQESGGHWVGSHVSRVRPKPRPLSVLGSWNRPFLLYGGTPGSGVEVSGETRQSPRPGSSVPYLVVPTGAVGWGRDPLLPSVTPRHTTRRGDEG